MSSIICASLRSLMGALCVIGLTLSQATAQPRELAVPPEAMIQVEVATVGMASLTGTPVVLLREPGAREVIPIYIGPVEAHAILRALTGERPRRPLTHELLGDLLGGLEVRLVRVYVDALSESTFFGMLELELPGREAPLHIDSRPSDAIALALGAGASIHVAPEVLEAAREIEYEGFEDQVVVALGISVTPLDSALRDALGLPDTPGLLISDVSGPAEAAGMAPGALLLEVNGRVPRSPMHFLELVRQTPRGEPARLGYWQQGEEHTLELSTEVPDPRPRRAPRETPGISI